MDQMQQFLGIVHDGEFQKIGPRGPHGTPVRLTIIDMQTALPPDSHKLDLAPYEAKIITVRGHESGGWIYSAEVVDQAGPIRTAAVRQVFKDLWDG